MLEPEILKPFLLDDDPWVRSAVARYFDEGWSQETDLIPLILDACDRFGYRENISSLVCCRQLPLTPPTFERVLQQLADVDHDNTAMHLSSILSNAPIYLLIKHETETLGNEYLLEDYRTRIQHRLKLRSWSGERLWQELQDLSQRYESTQNDSTFDSVYDDAVIAALVPHDVPDTGTICGLLTDPETKESWLESYLIDLVGFRRLGEAIPALVDMLRGDEASLPDNCSQALARIGHPEIVRRIRSCYAAESWSFRDSSAGLLGEIKHPESETAILAFLEEEKDIDIRTELCHGLCQLFSERGVEVVRQEVDDGYRGWIVTLEEVLLPVIHVLGIELLEADQWRREREEREQYQLERRREFEELDTKYDAMKEQGIDPFAKLDSSRESSGVASTTYRRHDGKIGRNDPCPCGSGKKYKKCCEGN